MLEVRRCERSIAADPREQSLGLAAAFAGEGADMAPADLAAIGPRHPPAQQRMQRERQQRGLVRPIFEQPPFPLAPPGGAIEQRPVVRAEPREGRKIMGPGQHVDAVDLVQPQPVEIAAKRRPVGYRRLRGAEALRRQRDPPGGCKRKRVGSAGHGATRAEAAHRLKARFQSA